MHKPIIGRILSIVDGSLVNCHGRSEFESRDRTLCFFLLLLFSFVFRFYIFINSFIYRYNSLSFPNCISL